MLRKPIFDIIRRLLGRGLRRREVVEIDAVLDAALPPDDPPPPLRRVGLDGIALIKRFEGCALRRSDGQFEAYPDPASRLARTGTGSGAPWTIGWGATGHGFDGPIGPGTVWTQERCDERLEADLARYADDVAEALSDAATTQQQFDALVSFHYNTGAIRRATLTRRHCAGDFSGAAAEFARWNRAGGRVLNGLVRRRAAEAELYRGGAKPEAPRKA